jgi:cbb3-type cytochrome oxidase subunit 3
MAVDHELFVGFMTVWRVMWSLLVALIVGAEYAYSESRNRNLANAIKLELNQVLAQQVN